jgi:hypothetical protein
VDLLAHAARGARLFFALWLAAPCFAIAGTVIEEIPGQPFFPFEYQGAAGFSGLTWVGGAEFFTVSDKVRAVFPMNIAVDPASGRILSATLGARIPVKTKTGDFEGIAFVADKRRLYISAEDGNSILGFDLRSRAVLPVGVPHAFVRARRNKGLESLTFDAKVGNFWTANEEALTGDGAASDSAQGTVVRLQRFDRNLRQAGQFAYRTEPSALRIENAGTGVSDLALLPNGELLVLERVVGLFGLSVKIFRADVRVATDVSGIPKLEGAEYTPAAKTLIFSKATLTANFEGIALGSPLESGWRSLILIADSGTGTTHHLMPLRIRWISGP